MATIVLPQDIQERIFAPIGYPVISEDDLEVSFDFLNSIAIYPAVREYFKYFPLVDQQFYTVSGNFSIDFPTTFTFGVVDARLHPGYDYKGINPENPFLAERVINTRPYAQSTGMYGTPYDYGMSEVIPIAHALKNAKRKFSKRYRIFPNEQTRVVEGFVNATSQLEVDWASYSENWSDIKYVYQEDVIALSSAYILQYFGRLRSQEETDLPVQFDATEFIDTANTIIEDVMERWRAATKTVVMRK